MNHINRIERLFGISFEEFLNTEAGNIASGVSERNLCARLAMLLSINLEKDGFHGYYVDPEYNRKQGGKVKTILDGDMNIISICCDIIIHTRGESIESDNLIAIEMKKESRPEREKQADRCRLRALTKSIHDDIWSYDGKTHPEHVCGYCLGIYIELDFRRRKWLLEYYRFGCFTESIVGGY